MLIGLCHNNRLRRRGLDPYSEVGFTSLPWYRRKKERREDGLIGLEGAAIARHLKDIQEMQRTFKHNGPKRAGPKEYSPTLQNVHGKHVQMQNLSGNDEGRKLKYVS